MSYGICQAAAPEDKLGSVETGMANDVGRSKVGAEDDAALMLEEGWL